MNGNKCFTIEAIEFAFKSLIEHVRLFVIVLLAGTGVISVVIALIGLLNKSFFQDIMASQALRDYQDCVGYDCATVAYQSGATVWAMINANFFSLLISAIVFALFFVGLDLGFKRVALDVHDRQDSSYKQLFSEFGAAPKAMVAWVLYCMMVWVGWLLLILPGFIAMIRFAFFPYFIVDKNMGPVESLKKSYEVTQHHMWDIFAFWVAMKIIVSLGFVSWMGIFISWPLWTLAYVCFYRKLVGHVTNHQSQYSESKMY